MRPRMKKHLNERLEKCGALLVREPETLRGCWRNGGRPLHLEIGCGKGAFICGMAALHPETDFVAVEIVRNIIVTAAEKAQAAELPNVRFISCDARRLHEIFAPGEVDRIYLNFSDPWPRNGHRKRRLTYPDFLSVYKEIMGGKGEVFQKTDNLGLFEASLSYYREVGWNLRNVTYDLHGDGPDPGNVITEYERRFMDLGQPIYRAEAEVR